MRSFSIFPAALALAVAVGGLAGAWTTAPPARAAEPAPVTAKETSLQRIQRMVAKINAEASTPEGEEAVVSRLSKQLRVAPDSLRTQHEEWGLGYGELAMVYGFARSSKKAASPFEVVEMRRSGTEWESIGKELGVKLDAVASRVKKSATSHPAPKSESH